MPPLRRARALPRALRRVLAGTILLAGAARAEPGPVVEYLTIAANEAGASGGHAALRLGARVFHFEAEDGLLRLQREPWPDFRFRYRVIENRTLHAQRLAVPAETAAALERHLDRRLWTEAAERDRLDALADDVRLLEAFAREARGGDAALAVPGAGFFGREGEASGTSSSRAIRALGRRIARERGPGYTARRLRDARAALREVAPDGTPDPPRSGGPGVPSGSTLSQRYGERLAAVRALETLRDAPSLRPAARVALPDDVAALSPAERGALRARRDALEADLARLVGSQRPDWGAAFRLGLARLAALAESLDTGRWVVLDALPRDARRVDAAAVRRVAGPLRRRLSRRRAALAEARHDLRARPARERDLARLEATASRTAELARALAAGGDLRVAPGPLVPRGTGLEHAPPLPDFAATGGPAALDALRASAQERLRAARAAHARRYDYDLVDNNCVTALFREVAAAAGPLPGSGARAADPPAGPLDRLLRALRFVPSVSARFVARSWPVAAERTLPSRRHERLAALRRDEPGWRVALRESNTLTSTVYAPNPLDSPFVFFTDGAVWVRPLLGAVNLATGLGDGAAGVLRLPFDRGHTLVRAVRGVAASLPELVFVNIRKGSFPFAEPDASSTGSRGIGAR